MDDNWAAAMSSDESEAFATGSDMETSDTDSQSDNEDAVQQRVMQRMAVGNAAPMTRQMPALMHLLAHRQLALHEPRPAASNEDLVSHLMRHDTLRTPALVQAMRLCPRDLFVPDDDPGKETAFADMPLALHLGFNISAPHMHAACMEALDLAPGQAVLDVGCGCGILTAMMASVVGRSGSVWGIDCKKRAISLARGSIASLEASNEAYTRCAATCTLRQHNVFLPAAFLTGKFDRVHVGAACPPKRIAALKKLLKPAGGIIVTPVTTSDLQRISVSDGCVKVETLSRVRYSNLEVPSDLEIVAAGMKKDRKARLAVPICPSTYEADLASVQDHVGTSLGSSASTSGSFWPVSSPTAAEGASPSEASPPAALTPSPSWGKRWANKLLGCSLTGMPVAGEGSLSMRRRSSSVEPASPCRLSPEDLGPYDFTLTGPGWSVPVHRAVLRCRCDHFRARCDSGMRDAEDAQAAVPEHFSQEPVRTFVSFCYEDEVDPRLDAQEALALLHVAHFFGAPRLAGLCDLALSRSFKHASPSDEGACDTACTLLGVADEMGLAHLRAVTLDFITRFYPQVQACPAYASLTKGQTDLVAAEACRLVAEMQRLMREVAV